ncbi:response regulator transcription factor [Paenibacillus tritici]|uniref:response regulator transcription factor n=1 Tax=Paenibacillus tritici TaxID=1873425 RepID=UPI001FEA1509|nr:response regulator transcription factor [Paenibacillus tritici]
MYLLIKVVIVDDEPKLRQGLQTLIPWGSLGYTVVAAAGNGREALKIIEEEAPEVVVADIRMPVMDGLQLIEQVRGAGHNTQFIILSGYADFEYAKQAIRYGVAGYLLKPVNIGEMSATLQLVRERIEEEERKRTIPQAETLDRDLYLHRLLVPQEKPGESIKLGAGIGQPDGLWSGSYEVVVIVPRVPEVELPDALNRLAAGLKAMAEERDLGAVTVISPHVVLLLNTPLRGSQRRDNLYGEIRNIAAGIRFIAATGGAVTEAGLICNSYSKAREAAKLSFFSDRDRLLEPDYPPVCPPVPAGLTEDNNEEYMRDVILRLYYCLDVGNKAMVAQLLNEAAAMYCGQRQDENHVKQAFFFLCNGIIHKLAAASRLEGKETEKVSHFLNGIYQHDRLQQLIEDIRRFLLDFVEESDTQGKEHEFKRMIDFIHKHYAEDLKLSTLAGLLNYSTPYLGQLFRMKTGEYFNTYLDKVRIQRAKELLAQGMKVYEVAEQVGYTSVNYFFSKFKKYEGRSPSDYKNP